MARNVSLGWPVRRGRPPGKTLASLPLPYGPFIPAPSACACAASIPLGSLLLGYKPLDFRPVPPPQPAQVQHTRPRLALVPRRVEPPAIALRLLQPGLQQPQQRHGQQLQLGGADDRVLRPRPALLPPEPLLEVAEPVLLPEPGAEQLHQLQPAQVAGTADDGEALAVALHLGDDRLDLDLVAGDRPEAHHLLVADVPPPPVQPRPALVPAAGPAPALAWRRQTPAPLGPRAALARRRPAARRPAGAAAAPRCGPRTPRRRQPGDRPRRRPRAAPGPPTVRIWSGTSRQPAAGPCGSRAGR